MGVESFLRRDKRTGTLQIGMVYAALWVLITVCLFDIDETWAGLEKHLERSRAHFGLMLIAPAVVLALSLATALVARCYAVRFPHAGMVAILCVISVDLWISHTRFVRLASHEPLVLPGKVGWLERYADIRDYPRVRYNDFRYYAFLDTALDNRIGYVGTLDGGVLPGSTERMFAAFASNTEPALAAASCSRVHARWHDRWIVLAKALPRVRAAPLEFEALVFKPIAELTLQDIESLAKNNQLRLESFEDRSNSIVMAVELEADGWLVLADTYYPGWKCSVDGRSVVIEAAHDVFRAVRVSQGRHVVEFDYRPKSIRFGLIGSASGVLMWLALVIVGVVKRRKAIPIG
jgi:hypothetical protein